MNYEVLSPEEIGFLLVNQRGFPWRAEFYLWELVGKKGETPNTKIFYRELA